MKRKKQRRLEGVSRQSASRQTLRSRSDFTPV